MLVVSENYIVPLRWHPKQGPHHAQLAKGNLEEAASKSFDKMCLVFPTWTFTLIFDIHLPPLASDLAVQSGLCIPIAFWSDFCYCLWNAVTDPACSFCSSPLMPPRSWKQLTSWPHVPIMNLACVPPEFDIWLAPLCQHLEKAITDWVLIWKMQICLSFIWDNRQPVQNS